MNLYIYNTEQILPVVSSDVITSRVHVCVQTSCTLGRSWMVLFPSANLREKSLSVVTTGKELKLLLVLDSWCIRWLTNRIKATMKPTFYQTNTSLQKQLHASISSKLDKVLLVWLDSSKTTDHCCQSVLWRPQWEETREYLWTSGRIKNQQRFEVWKKNSLIEPLVTTNQDGALHGYG